MNCGNVYIFLPDPSHPLGGRVVRSVEPLPNLITGNGLGGGQLSGRFVCVRNAGWVNQPDPVRGGVCAVPLNNAEPDAAGDFIYEPGRGGGRMDKVELAEPDFRARYIQAAHFGEVNTYYHLDRIAAYIDELLHELGAPSLPPVTAVVNAHHAATEKDGLRDGVFCGDRWLPFQGGHYRLPGSPGEIIEHDPVAPTGEIHFGPGYELLEYGALVEAAGGRYRANASHNAGIIYHEYGHHIARHTADFRANALRPPDCQSNRKIDVEEGICDYWAAVMQGTPHIWLWHQRHNEVEVHRRSLSNNKTMASYVPGRHADAHENGTIWASALWSLRQRMAESDPAGGRQADLLLLKSLLLVGDLKGDPDLPPIRAACRARGGFSTGLRELLLADKILFSGIHCELILENFTVRGIHFENRISIKETPPKSPAPPALFQPLHSLIKTSSRMQRVLKHVGLEELPETADLSSPAELEAELEPLGDAPWSLIGVGDIMIGGNARKFFGAAGPDYQFEAVAPLLRRAPIVMGNLEGPFARQAAKLPRNFSYQIKPKFAPALLRAGINVVSIANNHLLDCGRAGVLETLGALSQAGIHCVGGGRNRRQAHAPCILQAGPLRIGMLGYYWNRRTAATDEEPGSAMDTPEDIERDIRDLRPLCDRIVLSVHWGVPYEREPSAEDRAKAHFAIECGADVIIGHHPHIIQPLQIHRGRPIFYSTGNFTFGSGNSRAESLLVALRFDDDSLHAAIYPVYVKNRDPRVNYQPRVMRGPSAERVLARLREISGISGEKLKIEAGRGFLELPR